MDDVCVHKERSLAKGTLLDGQVICPGHQWKFDPRTGRPEDQARLPGHLAGPGLRGGRRPDRHRPRHAAREQRPEEPPTSPTAGRGPA